MGGAIAQRMVAEQRTVFGWTRSGRAVDSVESAADLETLVAKTDVLILSLFDDAAVTEILDSLLQLDLTGKLIIETSTISPAVLKDRIDEITTRGATAVDAPISGGPELVLAGSCGVFIGGDDAAAARAQGNLVTISNRIAHVGPLGTGLVMKVINNGMIQTYFAGLSELMPLARRAGLPLETALRILCAGPAGMPLISNRIDKITGKDDSIGFAINAAFKDNAVCKQVLDSFGLDAPILDRFEALKPAVSAAGYLHQDPAALVSLAYEKGDD